MIAKEARAAGVMGGGEPLEEQSTKQLRQHAHVEEAG